jgi:hypothetical protein
MRDRRVRARFDILWLGSREHHFRSTKTTVARIAVLHIRW